MSVERSASLVDSHCHIDFPELAADIDGMLARMAANGVTHALCVSVNLEDFPRVLALARAHAARRTCPACRPSPRFSPIPGSPIR